MDGDKKKELLFYDLQMNPQGDEIWSQGIIGLDGSRRTCRLGCYWLGDKMNDSPAKNQCLANFWERM